MFTDIEMKEMYEKYKDKISFEEFEKEVITYLNEQANKARKRADKAVENREVE